MDAEAVAAYDKHADELIRFAAALVGPSGAEDVTAVALTRVLAGDSWQTLTNLRAYRVTV